MPGLFNDDTEERLTTTTYGHLRTAAQVVSVPSTEHEEPVDGFDAGKLVRHYRRVIEQRDATTAPQGKAELHAIAKRMEKAWKDAKGKDSLFDTAFGKPWD